VRAWHLINVRGGDESRGVYVKFLVGGC
jgi:hypothetical protein